MKKVLIPLVLLNSFVWLLSFYFGTKYPFLLSFGGLAYTFGLRHAVDADHIAAIDNTTRKFVAEKKDPKFIGFFFSLGHSTVIILLSIGVIFSAQLIKEKLPSLEKIGSVIGTLVSASFLYIIGIINFFILIELYKSFKEIKKENKNLESVEGLLQKRGLMNALLQKVIKAVNKPYKMYFVGFLFGLGFDTASEVAILGMSAGASSKGFPIFIILILPLLFTAGMSLVDTVNGIIMSKAYSWAFINPFRKMYYNFLITASSVLIAISIGTIETFQILSSELKLKGGFWDKINNLDFETIGYFIVGFMISVWTLFLIKYNLEEKDER